MPRFFSRSAGRSGIVCALWRNIRGKVVASVIRRPPYAPQQFRDRRELRGDRAAPHWGGPRRSCGRDRARRRARRCPSPPPCRARPGGILCPPFFFSLCFLWSAAPSSFSLFLLL